MKGAVFIALNEMIEANYGLAVWEELLDKVNPESNGIYTSTENYPDEEIVNFVLAISDKVNLPSTEVTKIFGRYLFDELNSKYPLFTNLTSSLFEFLNSIENVIHKEVRKLHENPSLPTLDCEIENKNTLLLKYHSPRKLCFLAEGLIQGAADFYDEKIVLSHDQCMHEGHENCILRVKKNG